MIAGGPVINLLCGVLSGAYFLSLGYNWDGDSFLSSGASIYGFGVLSFAGWSLLFFLVNLIPCRISGFLTDGAQLLQLLRRGPKAERQAAVFLLAGMAWGGQRARDWPRGLVEKATASPDGSAEDVTASLLAYYWLLDLGNVDGASGYLKRALAARENYPIASRSGLYREAAYFFARHQGDAQAARAYLEQGRGGLVVSRHNELRAEAAVLLAEGSYDASLKRANDGLATLRRADGTYPAGDAVDLLRDIANLAARRKRLQEIPTHSDREEEAPPPQ